MGETIKDLNRPVREEPLQLMNDKTQGNGTLRSQLTRRLPCLTIVG